MEFGSASKSVLFLVLVFWLSGCVQTSSVPGYARGGDYIVIGLGGVERNADGAATLKTSDLTIQLTDINQQPHTLEARFMFKSYADYASVLNEHIQTNQVAAFGLTNMAPYDGTWFAVVPLTVPQQWETPLVLPEGAANISVTSPKLTNINNGIEGDLTNIPIEILAGTSAPDVNYIRQFLGYATTLHNFVIAPDDLSGISEVGGGYFVIEYSDDSFFKSGSEPLIVPSEHNPYVQLSYNVVPNGDGTGTIYVTLLNPAGFKTQASAAPNSSLLSNLAFKLMYLTEFSIDQSVINQNIVDAKASFSVDTVESYYIGMDGATLAGVSPVMIHNEDL